MAKNFDADTKGINLKLTADASGITQAIRNVDRDLNTVQKSLRTVQNALKFDPSSIENLRKKVVDLNTKSLLLTNSISLLKEKEGVLRKELEIANKAVADNTLKYGENSDETKAAVKTRDRLQKSLDSTRAKLKNEETTLSSLDSQFSDTQGSIASLTKRSVSGMSEVDNKIARLKGRLGDLDDEYKANEAGTKSASSALEAYGNQQNVLSQKMNTLKELIGQYQVKLSELKDEYEKAGKALEELKSQEGNHSAEIQKAQNSYDQLDIQIRQTEKELNNTKAALTATGGKYDDNAKKIDKLRNGEKEEAEQQKEAAKATEQAGNSLNAFNVALGNLISSGIQKAISGLKDLAKNIYDTGTGFEDAMSGLAAIELKATSDSGIQTLSNQFKDLSKNSKYSATDIATNAQVLANAGYNVDQISSSINVLSDLAVGTGEDFSSMASIVVDGLASFKMSSDQAAHFANVLAKSAISANTNVSQMGDAFKYVAPVAGSLGYKVEDVGLAMDLMANNGIKASQAGTSLRTILTRLSTNTSKANDLFTKLGGSFFDSTGKAEPLRKVLEQLRTGLKKLTPEQQIAAEKTIAGERAVSALSAIVNASDDDFNRLTGDVDNYNGTVEKMAGIRMDTVSGDVDRLKNNWSNLASELLKEVEPGLRRVLQSLNALMSSPAFKKDIAGLAKSASSALQSLAKWIDKNGVSAISAAKSVATFIAAFGGADIASSKVLTLSSKVGEFANQIIVAAKKSKTASDATKAAGDVASSAVEAVGSATKEATTSSSGFITNLISTAVESKKLGLVIGGVSLAVGALSGLIAVSVEKYKEEQAAQEAVLQKHYGLTDAMQSNIDEIGQLNDSWSETTKVTKENVSAIQGQYNGYRLMAQQYDQIVDKNGQVIKGHEAQAQVIKTTLANAFGLESGDLDNLISKYGSMSKAIENVSAKKEADAVLSAYQDQYTEAVTKSGNALNNMVRVQADYETQSEKLTKAKQAQKDAEDQYNAAVKNTTLSGQAYNDAVDQAAEKVAKASQATGEAQKSENELSKAYDKARKTYEGYQDTIANYEGVQAAIESGNTAGVKSALTDLENGFKHATDTNLDALQKQYDGANKTYNELLTAQKNHNSSVTDEAVRGAKDYVDKTAAELAKGKQIYNKTADENGAAYIDTINSKKGAAVTAGKNVGDASGYAAKDVGKFKDSAVANISTYNSAVNGQVSNASKAGKNISNATKSGSRTNLSDEGKNAGSTYSSGVSSQSGSASSAGKRLGNSAKNSSKVSLHSEGNNAGSSFVSGLSGWIGSAASAASRLGSAVAKAVKSALKIGSPSKVMISLANFTGGAFVDTLGDYSSEAYQNAKLVATQAITGFNTTLANGTRQSIATARLYSDSAINAFGGSAYGANGVFSRDLNTAGATVNNNNSTYSPNVIINVTQNEGENEESFARRVADIINSDVIKKGTVWR